MTLDEFLSWQAVGKLAVLFMVTALAISLARS